MNDPFDYVSVPMKTVKMPGLSGWRPISTAPKDGTWVIIYDPFFVTEMPVSIGTYMTADERDPRGRFRKGEWLLFEWDGMPSSANPTHWMPLPPPPSPQ